jgi:hypothetical protein
MCPREHVSGQCPSHDQPHLTACCSDWSRHTPPSAGFGRFGNRDRFHSRGKIRLHPTRLTAQIDPDRPHPDRPPSTPPEANSPLPQIRTIIGRSSPGVFHQQPRSHHVFTIVSPQFHQPIFRFRRLPLPKISADKPNKARKEPEIHHNPPQTPKIHFIHKQSGPSTNIDFTPPAETLLP